MFNKRGIALYLLTLILCACPLAAEELHESFSHSLGIGSSAQSYEHRIDLPTEWAAQGRYFIGRKLALDGKLVIEREELTKTYYYVKVRLPKATLWFAKGSIDITLTAEDSQATIPAPSSPTELKIEGSYKLNFSWNGSGSYSAITLMDRNTGKTLWERVILADHQCELDEDNLKVGGKYMWAVKMADYSGRYSKETQAKFRIGTKEERCYKCRGTGYVTCTRCHGSGHIVVNGPDNTPVSQICHSCHGTGRERCTRCFGQGHVTVPVAIPEY